MEVKSKSKPSRLTRALPTFVLVLLPLEHAALAQTNQIRTNVPAIAATNRLSPVVSNPPAAVLTNSTPVDQVATAPRQAVQTVLPAMAPTNVASSTAPAKRDNSGYAILLSVLTLAYTIWKDYKTSKRVKALEEEQAHEKAAAAIRVSKASAPYFSPSKQPFYDLLYDCDENDNTICYTPDETNVLSIRRKEIPQGTPEGTLVIVILDVKGGGARRFEGSGDIPVFDLTNEPEPHGKGRVLFKYPYKPSQHGQTQKVILSFETDDGHNLTHTYETRHGCFEFHRIDPK